MGAMGATLGPAYMTADLGRKNVPMDDTREVGYPRLQEILERVGRRDRSIHPGRLEKYDELLRLARDRRHLGADATSQDLARAAAELIEEAIASLSDRVDRLVAEAALGATKQFEGLSVTTRKETLADLHGISVDVYKRRRPEVFRVIAHSLARPAISMVDGEQRDLPWLVGYDVYSASLQCYAILGAYYALLDHQFYANNDEWNSHERAIEMGSLYFVAAVELGIQVIKQLKGPPLPRTLISSFDAFRRSLPYDHKQRRLLASSLVASSSDMVEFQISLRTSEDGCEIVREWMGSLLPSIDGPGPGEALRWTNIFTALRFPLMRVIEETADWLVSPTTEEVKRAINMARGFYTDGDKMRPHSVFRYRKSGAIISVLEPLEHHERQLE